MHWMITERPRALAIVMLDEDKLADVARGGCAEATSTDATEFSDKPDGCG
jgi:hypothetical protein